MDTYQLSTSMSVSIDKYFHIRIRTQFSDSVLVFFNNYISMIIIM